MIAVFTFVWFFACVYTDMTDEVVFFSKLFVTEFTLVFPTIWRKMAFHVAH